MRAVESARQNVRDKVNAIRRGEAEREDFLDTYLTSPVAKAVSVTARKTGDRVATPPPPTRPAPATSPLPGSSKPIYQSTPRLSSTVSRVLREVEEEEEEEEEEEDEEEWNPMAETVYETPDDDIDSGFPSRPSEPYQNIWATYLDKLLRKETDHVYGPRIEPDVSIHGEKLVDLSKARLGEESIDPYPSLYFGNKKIEFLSNGLEFAVGDHTFDSTPGLLDLMFEKRPQMRYINRKDKDNYIRLLELTNAHYLNYERDQGLKHRLSSKFISVILKLLREKSARDRARRTSPLTKVGKGMRFGKPPAYKYWRDPNALVSRLALLRALKRAGNSSRDAEAYQIENELRDSQLTLENEDRPTRDAIRYGIASELHAPARRRFRRRRVETKHKDEAWQCDLAEMIPYAKSNGGMKYILTVIDVYSKYAWAEPVSNKTGAQIVKVLDRIPSKKLGENRK